MGDAAMLAVSNDDFRTFDPTIQDLMRNVADLGDAVADREPRFRGVDAHVVGARVLRYEIVSHVSAVALGVHRQERRTGSQPFDRRRPEQAVSEICRDYYVGGGRDLGNEPIEILLQVIRQRLVIHDVDFE